MTRLIEVDIVSDVVCPWCVVGWRQLARAMAENGIVAGIRWHPFELNPAMPDEGQNLRDHIMEKYGSTPEDSDRARDRLREIGAGLGFTFGYGPDSRMVNTFRAHQLIEWADDLGRRHEMKQALLHAYFTDQKDISNPGVLAEIAGAAGFDAVEAATVLADQRFAEAVRGMEQFWISKGIRGVPAMVFRKKYLMTGAQGVENYAAMLRRMAAEIEAEGASDAAGT
jgi:predicted DsbA family dithiol-disulfide isomerase